MQVQTGQLPGTLKKKVAVDLQAQASQVKIEAKQGKVTVKGKAKTQTVASK